MISWEVDLMGVDLVGVDLMRFDLVRVYTSSIGVKYAYSGHKVVLSEFSLAV